MNRFGQIQWPVRWLVGNFSERTPRRERRALANSLSLQNAEHGIFPVDRGDGRWLAGGHRDGQVSVQTCWDVRLAAALADRPSAQGDGDFARGPPETAASGCHGPRARWQCGALLHLRGDPVDLAQEQQCKRLVLDPPSRCRLLASTLETHLRCGTGALLLAQVLEGFCFVVCVPHAETTNADAFRAIVALIAQNEYAPPRPSTHTHRSFCDAPMPRPQRGFIGLLLLC